MKACPPRTEINPPVSRKQIAMKKSAQVLTALTLALTLTALPAAAQPLPTASPESVGFDSARLKKLDEYMAGVVAEDPSDVLGCAFRS